VADLSTTIGSLRLKNPTLLASGIMNEDAGSMQRMIDCGAGAIVTKSIGMQPREGYANPTVLELEFGLLNAMGLPNPGIDQYSAEIKKLQKSKTPIIGSIYASDVKEFITLASKMKQYGAV
jgi:dihydroorotate dehydrogenase (NAD+) catalytic subunit